MNNKKSFPWIIIVIVLVVAAGVAYYMTSSKDTDAQQTSPVQKEIFTPTVKDGSFVTNLKNSRHFIKVSMVIEVANKQILDEFTSKDYVVNDIIISVLSNKTDEEAADENFQAKLKNEIIAALNKQFGSGAVISIYFNEFVIQ